MSVTLGHDVGANNLYIGLSTDTKPVDGAVQFFSQFYEYDTGHRYRWVGTVAGWVEDLLGDPLGDFSVNQTSY